MEIARLIQGEHYYYIESTGGNSLEVVGLCPGCPVGKMKGPESAYCSKMRGDGKAVVYLAGPENIEEFKNKADCLT